MRIVHITTIDEGGAYKAVVRIDRTLNNIGIDSDILLRNKNNKDNFGNVYLNNIFALFLSKVRNFVNLLSSKNEIACERFGCDVSNHPLVTNANVIAIHWCSSFLSFASIKKIIDLGKPVVFFMHDVWAYTGGCHVNLDCYKYVNQCCDCPFISGNKQKDLSYINSREKKRLFSASNVYFVGPSNWIVDNAKKSYILNGTNIEYLPNCIDGEIFYDMHCKSRLRKKYSVPNDKKVVLFGAAFDGTANKNKGFSYLIDALDYLDVDEYYLMVFGECNPQCHSWKHEYKLMGYIKSEYIMAELYNLADVYVSPSLQESFGFTVCESLACGTPVVAFSVGGLVEQIEHQKNGYLAENFSSEDIAKGIVYCTDDNEQERLAKNASSTASKYYSTNLAKSYKTYFETLNDRRESK